MKSSPSDSQASDCVAKSSEIVCPADDEARWFADTIYSHDSSLRSYLRRAFPSVRDVEDVVQESYLRVWKVRAAQPVQFAKAFLFTIARRIAIDVLRHDRRSPIDLTSDSADLDVSFPESDVSEIACQNETADLLIEAIDSLPARCREIVILRKLKFLSQRQVAERLGISEKGVENQLARGLVRCREFLRRRGVRNLYSDE